MQHRIITPESMDKIAKCFTTDEDEAQQFISSMDLLNNELDFYGKMRLRTGVKESAQIMLHQVAVFALYCKDNLEMIRQLVGLIDSYPITEQELKELKDDE